MNYKCNICARIAYLTLKHLKMETKVAKNMKKTSQKIQLVKGEFSPSEASHIVIKLIDEKINFHKVQRLQMYEGNHHCETEELDGRIKELEEEKRIAKKFIGNTKDLGKRLKIDGVLHISVSE